MNDLHLTPAARADLKEIKRYISEDLQNPKAALSTTGKITKEIRRLRDHALIGAMLSSVADTQTDHRFLVSGNYMVFYRVSGRDVYIDRVLYGRSNYMSLLFEELPGEESAD